MINGHDIDERELARRRREVASAWCDDLSNLPVEVISAAIRELVARLPSYELKKQILNAAASDAIRFKRMSEGK